jgi:hypothetical protein
LRTLDGGSGAGDSSKEASSRRQLPGMMLASCVESATRKPAPFCSQHRRSRKVVRRMGLSFSRKELAARARGEGHHLIPQGDHLQTHYLGLASMTDGLATATLTSKRDDLFYDCLTRSRYWRASVSGGGKTTSVTAQRNPQRRSGRP